VQDKHGLSNALLGPNQWVSNTRKVAFRLVSYTPLDRLPYNLQDFQDSISLNSLALCRLHLSLVGIQSSVYGLLHRLQELGDHGALAGLGSLLRVPMWILSGKRAVMDYN